MIADQVTDFAILKKEDFDQIVKKDMLDKQRQFYNFLANLPCFDNIRKKVL